jgi:hypothetical protein
MPAPDAAPADRAAQPQVQVVTAAAAPLVLVAGLATTLLALAAVWALSAFAGQNVMGWYASYVLPAGAILVGVVASSGFGVTSWVTGTKVTGRLLVATAVILVAGYWAAHYLEFRLAFPGGATFEDGTPAGFLDWYDVVTRSFAWKDHGKLGAPLGAWGYALRAAELIGFAGGGLAAPLVMRNMPYCASCGVYMRQPVVAVVPAGVAPKRLPKKDAAAAAAREAEAGEALARAQAGVARMVAAGRSGDAAAFSAAVEEVGPLSRRRAADKLTARMYVRVVHCRRCGEGRLRIQLATGRGEHVKMTDLATEPLERGVAPRLLRRR